MTKWLRHLTPRVAQLAGLLASLVAGIAAADDAALGQRLFKGLARFEQPPTVNAVPLPAAECARCHGARGEGRSEGGVDVPALRGQALLLARGAQPAFADMPAVLAAVTRGVGRGGRALDATMPRYAMNETERRAIAAYLSQLQGAQTTAGTGVSADEIRIGMIAPASGPLSAAAALAREGMRARIEQANRQGGVYGRRIVLEMISAATSSEATLAAVREAHARAPMLALVGNLFAGDAAALSARAAQLGLPSVASIAMPYLQGNAGASDGGVRATYLLPSIETQAVDAASALAHDCPAAAGNVAIVYDAAPGFEEIAASAASRLLQRGVDARAVARAERAGIEARAAVLVLGATQGFEHAESAGGPRACTGALAVLAGATHTVDLVALPWKPAAGDAQQLWRDLGAAAGGVLVEGLLRAGRDLDADALVAAVDSLRGFEAAPGFPVTFSSTRRHALGEAVLAWSRRR